MMPKGGFRPGSGRKIEPDNEKSVKKLLTFPADVAAYLETKPNVSRYVSELILEDMKRKTE
jgi:hypothetical protein